MVNIKTYQKGRKAEIERIKHLESLGYKCISAPKGNAFSKQKDLFNFWDIVAYMPNTSGDFGWLVEQVKCNKGVMKTYREAAKDLPRGTKANLSIRIDGNSGKPVEWKIIDLRE